MRHNNRIPWFVYILFCDQKTYYIGLTSNLQQRILSHKAKHNISTKEFSDIQLVYSEEYTNRHEAEKREKQLKGWTAAKKNALITGNTLVLIRLSKSKSVVDGKSSK